MLTASIEVPSDAETVVLWFTYESPESGLHFDSDGGQNFWFPFVSEQIKVVAADVVTDAQAGRSEFLLTAAAAPNVEQIAVRVQPTDGAPIAPDPELNKTQETDAAGWPLWSVRVPVPFKAIVRFKLFYWLQGVRYKDDNSNRYYLAPRPPAETLPPIPKELVDVLRSGKWR